MGRLLLLRAGVVCLVLGVAAGAHAQVSLTGTYISYLEVGANGCMVVSTTAHSMAYTETGSPPTSCDAYYPGAPEEGWTVQATSSGGAMLTATNLGPSGGAFGTTSTTAVSGRNITWSGTYTAGTDVLHIDETFSYQTDDRVVHLNVVLTNMGSATLTDVYYLRDTDPDQGSGCLGGSGTATTNDVVLQPPTDSDAFATSAATVGGVSYIIGLGAHDARARVNTSGFGNTNGSALWAAPVDGAGASSDIAADVVFKEPTLAAGASTTFDIYYVWATDAATVLTRFLDTGTSPCTGADGSACTSTMGAAGTCHALRCCTGCWDGAACHAAGTSTACGIGGGSCTNCTDTNVCTQDVCSRTAGTCSHPGMPATTSCNDGLFCTASDHCDGTSACVGTGTPCDDANSCTTDSCGESTDTCSHVTLADLTGCPSGVCRAGACCTGCWNGTTCQGGFLPAVCGASGALCTSCVDGDQCTNDVCSAGACSNPLSSTSVACNDGNYCTVGDHCDGADGCTSGTGTPCDDGSTCTTDACDEATDSCSHMAASGVCAIFGSCFAAGDRNPSNRCQVCDPTMSTSAWTIAVGMDCGTAVCAAGMITPSPTCTATGGCTPSTRMPCPAGFCASSTMCATMCAMDSDCGATGYCDATTGMCTPRVAPGTVCDRDAMCVAGVCSADHHCCGSACTTPCQSCGIPGDLGRCLPVPAGTDPDGECGSSGETCTAAGTCGTPGVDGGTADMGGGMDLGTPPVDMGGGDAVIHGESGPGPDGGGGMRGGGGCCGVAGAGGNDALGAMLAGLAAFVLVRRRRKAC